MFGAVLKHELSKITLRRIPHDRAQRRHAHGPIPRLGMSTFAFTVCFAVWTIFSIIGVQIKEDLGAQRYAIRAARGHAGADRVGQPHLPWRLDRTVRRADHVSAADADTRRWPCGADQRRDLRELPASAALDRRDQAGRSSSASPIPRWFEKERQGTALGIFGAGNVGGGVTQFAAPFSCGGDGLGGHGAALRHRAGDHGGAVLRPRQDRSGARRGKRTGAPRVDRRSKLEPLKNIQVWRFATYGYFFVIRRVRGAASFLPRYYFVAYGLELTRRGVFMPGSFGLMVRCSRAWRLDVGQLGRAGG